MTETVYSNNNNNNNIEECFVLIINYLLRNAVGVDLTFLPEPTI